ncbi:MAG: hypothetical protein ACAI25_10955, partial [Planctomycetota bacterium]
MRVLAAALVALVLVAAPALAEEEVASILSLGSEKDRTLELHGLFYLAGLKSRSHFGFGSDGFRKGEPNFGRDLGFSAFLPGFGLDATVNVGLFGFVSAEVIHVEERGNVDQLDRLRRTSGVRLEEGDILESSAAFTWGGIEYGWEARIRLLGWLDLALAPTIGVGALAFDVSLARLLPEATRDLGGRAGALVVAPGVRVRVEAFGIVRLGFEGDFGLTGRQLALTRHYTTLWEHFRAFVGVNVLGADLTVGWRLDAMHLSGGGDYMDLRIDGAFASLG